VRRRRRLRRTSAAVRVEAGDLSLVQIDVRHLSRGVHPGVGASGDDEARIPAEDPGEGILEGALYGAQPGLARPAAKVRAVIGDIEPDAHPLSLLGPSAR
jgi:hypothetical protein